MPRWVIPKRSKSTVQATLDRAAQYGQADEAVKRKSAIRFESRL